MGITSPPALAVRALPMAAPASTAPSSTTGSLPVTMATPHPALHPTEAGLPPPSPAAAEHGAGCSHLRANRTRHRQQAMQSRQFHFPPIYAAGAVRARPWLLRGGRHQTGRRGRFRHRTRTVIPVRLPPSPTPSAPLGDCVVIELVPGTRQAATRFSCSCAVADISHSRSERRPARAPAVNNSAACPSPARRAPQAH